MGFIALKKRDMGNEKGLLIIKHMEYSYFHNMPKRLIDQVKDVYNIGLYFGFYTKRGADYKDVDFYIAEDNVLNIKSSEKHRINFNGYNFIGDDFCQNTEKNRICKDYDFIFIGDASNRKNLYGVISAVNKILTRGQKIKILIINRINRRNLYHIILNARIRRLLSKIKVKDRNSITYLEADSSLGYLIPKNIIVALLKKSKALILVSRAEGAARVVAEALLLGLNVIGYKGSLGGTNNHLSSKYDIIVDDLSKLDTSMQYFMDNYDNHYRYKDINYSDLFCEKITKDKFLDELSSLLGYSSLQIKHLLRDKVFYNSLSSHNHFLPRDVPSNKKTDECISNASMYKLLCFSLNKSPNHIFLFGLKVRDFISNFFVLPKMILLKI